MLKATIDEPALLFLTFFEHCQLKCDVIPSTRGNVGNKSGRALKKIER